MSTKPAVPLEPPAVNSSWRIAMTLREFAALAAILGGGGGASYRIYDKLERVQDDVATLRAEVASLRREIFPGRSAPRPAEVPTRSVP